jgi:hypothetical protein
LLSSDLIRIQAKVFKDKEKCFGKNRHIGMFLKSLQRTLRLQETFSPPLFVSVVGSGMDKNQDPG